MDLNDVTTQQGALTNQTSNGTPAEEPSNPPVSADVEAGVEAKAEPIEKPADPREEAINRIRQRVLAERQGEDADVEAGAEPATESATKDAEPVQIDSQQAGSPLFEKEGKYYTKVKIDGEEREVSFDQIKAVAQKNFAADRRLGEAAQAMQHIQAERARLEAERAQFEANQSTPSPSATEADDGVNSIVDAIYAGDEDAARKALSQFKTNLQTGNSATTVTTDGVAQKAAQEVLQVIQQREYQNALRSGYEKFKQEYPDILGDERLQALADQETTRIQMEDPQLPPERVMLEAGQRVRSWFSDGRTAPSSDRQARKARAGSPVRSVNATTQLSPQIPQRKTREDVIREMKAKRGQVA